MKQLPKFVHVTIWVIAMGLNAWLALSGVEHAAIGCLFCGIALWAVAF